MPLPSLPLVPRPLLQLGRLLWLRARGPAQRAATGALSRLGQRWPMLADIIGGYIAPRPPVAKRPSARARDTASATTADTLTPTGATAADKAPDVPVAELISELGDSRDFRTRLRAAQQLGALDDPQAGAALIGAVRDRSAEVAIAATEALGARGGEDNRQALRAVVLNAEGFHNALVRAAAVRALGQLGNPEDDALLHGAMRDVDAEVSVSAIAVAAERDGARDAEALLSLLQDGSRFFLPLTRLSAARALGHLSHLKQSDVSRLLETERDADVRNTLQRIVARDS